MKYFEYNSYFGDTSNIVDSLEKSMDPGGPLNNIFTKCNVTGGQDVEANFSSKLLFFHSQNQLV